MSQTNIHQSFRGVVDLTNCDREPIHRIGAIQPFGFLIAASLDLVVERISENAGAHLGIPVDALLGANLVGTIPDDAVHAIRNRMSSLHGGDGVERAFAVRMAEGGDPYDLAVHRSGDLIVIEAEPTVAAGDLNAGAMVRSMLDRVRGRMHEGGDLAGEAARLMQALTGFDRVMVYRFHPDGSGEVVAERARSGLDPYLGLRYPAGDIPVQARALMVRNPVRVLADVGGADSPILSRSASQEPLDLSMSTLRAHSAMHIEYLKNMGARATMTVSLLRDGKLWGMFSCHHMTPRRVDLERRTTAELFAQMLSFMLESRDRDEVAAYEARTRTLHNALVAAVAVKADLGPNIATFADQLAELIPCDGIGICVDDNVTLTGAAPTREEFDALRRYLEHGAVSQILAIEGLGVIHPPARDFAARAAGMLVIPLSNAPRDYVVFFRRELACAVTWAGNPAKNVEAGPHGVRLTPRKSFEAWREVVSGHSTPWTDAELHAAEALRVTLLEVVLHMRDVTDRERAAAAQRQELLIAELNHRVRNILGLIRGLVTQSRTSAVDVDAFASVLGDRVHALARAHDQITAKNWGPGPLAALIATEAGAYLGAGAARVEAAGAPVLLQPQAFSTMALVIHELMTNAAKYGALSAAAGQVRIAWALEANGDLVLDWNEVGGPSVQAPTRRGFGSTIIQRSIPHELGGHAAIDYIWSGLRARFTLPARHVLAGEDAGPSAVAAPGKLIPGQPAASPSASSAATSAMPPTTPLSGPVLLVEDNMMIALDAEEMLLALGAARVAVASNVAEALRLIAAERPGFALLDVNLGIETSWPVASALLGLGVAHIFATGYGSAIDYPAEHRATPTITKPYTSDSIARAVREAMTASQAAVASEAAAASDVRPGGAAGPDAGASEGKLSGVTLAA